MILLWFIGLLALAGLLLIGVALVVVALLRILILLVSFTLALALLGRRGVHADPLGAVKNFRPRVGGNF